MLIPLLSFEWRYHTRQVSFAAAVALFFLFGLVLAGTGFGPDNIHLNSPYSIAQSIGMLSLFSVFILAVFCANAVVRDRETRMEEIVFTTSVRKLPFLLGRFLGSFLAAFTAFSASAVGMFLAQWMPWQEADRLGPVQIGPYLWALLVIALPNMLFAGVVLFALSTVTRSVLASYAGSVLIYILYFVAAALTNSPMMAASAPGVQNDTSLAALLDPFALSAFFEQTQHWTPTIRNTRLVSLSGNFLLNRLLWIGISTALLAIVYRLFAFRVLRPSGKARRIETLDSDAPLAPYTPVDTEPLQWRSYAAMAKLEIRTFLLTLPFLAMTLLWTALAAFELLSDLSGGEYGSASYPAAGILFDTLHQPLTLITTILLIYTSAELIWRERTVRIAGILNATPTSNAVLVASKCTALSALVVLWTGTALVAMAAIQLANGITPNPLLLLHFAYYAAAPLVLFACMAVVIQTLSPHKYLGMLLVLLLGLLGMRGDLIGLHHPLWRFASAPTVVYSDMNAFGRTGVFHGLMLYWAAFTVLLLLLAIVLWRQTAEKPRALQTMAVLCAILFVASGTYVYSNTTHETQSDRLQWRADYETTFKRFATLPQPKIEKLVAQVDLYPTEHRYRVRGHYDLLNATSQPITTILVPVRRDATNAQITIPDTRVEHDAKFNQSTFTLATPLQPGARTQLQFDITYNGDDADPTILDNGSYIPSHRAFPTIGYRRSYELDDPRERRRHHLPAAAVSREVDVPRADQIQFDVTISTERDQIAIAPGRLVRSWEHDGRRSFQFRSDAPTPNQFIIASGRYAVARETHNGLPVEVYYHPSHKTNVARMMRAAGDTLRYCSSNFATYRYPALRLVEVPAQFRNFSGYAQPGVIFLGENRAFQIDAARDPHRLDLVYRRVAHEVAHQWWGYTLTPADAPGAAMITESLTKYTELMVLERAYGREQVRQSLTYELDAYLSGRTGERAQEPPLMRVDDQSYLYYRKGALVLYAIKDLIGEQSMNSALRTLLARQQDTAQDFVRQLHAVAPQSTHALLDQWLNDVVLYDFTLDAAQSRRLPNGQYELRLHVTAKKTRGEEQPLPMRESIELAVFSADDTPLFLAKHDLHDGAQDITVIVDKEPSTAAVDPYLLRIDRNRFDNTKRVQ